MSTPTRRLWRRSRVGGAVAIIGVLLTATACSAADPGEMAATTMASDPLRRFEAVLHGIAGDGIPEPGVLVEVEQFFDGSVNVGSIAPNLVVDDPKPIMRHPGVDVIRDRLLQIRDRPDVSAVLLDIMVEWERYPDGDWPYAQGVVVVTSASPETVDGWVADLNTDPSYLADRLDAWVNPPEIAAALSVRVK